MTAVPGRTDTAAAALRRDGYAVLPGTVGPSLLADFVAPPTSGIPIQRRRHATIWRTTRAGTTAAARR